MDSSKREESDPEYSFSVLEDNPTGAGTADDDDDIEELRKSLKDIVQDQTVKPKLQCLMVDPSFSMVTAQSEDSGIVWETMSSRCSTPWASEGSTTSEAYSLEGSGAQGKVIIIMDEDKIVRKRKKRSGKLGERLKRPTSRNFPGGNERPFMTEVSVPNIKSEGTDENGESKGDKEQQLFSLVSEGYEILNIVVPSKLATVDEEESTEMEDNLSYLESTPKINSKPKCELTEIAEITSEEAEREGQKPESIEEKNIPSVEGEPPHNLADKEARKEGTGDLDYLEKFTLVDAHLPDDYLTGAEENIVEMDEEHTEPMGDQQKSVCNESGPGDTFVVISSAEIASEHLDEVFYKNEGHEQLDNSALSKYQETDEEGEIDKAGSSDTPLKEYGSSLFDGQETTLTPIFLSPGPPKIIDPVLLEEPTAMSFLYADLYEEAIGYRKKEEDFSDVESVVSEKSFHRRLSDSDDASGYLEKFTLKDETPVMESEPTSTEQNEGGLQMWPQSLFQLTGCLTRVEEESKTEDEINAVSGEKTKSTECIKTTQSFVNQIKSDVRPKGLIESTVSDGLSVKDKMDEPAGSLQPTTLGQEIVTNTEHTVGKLKDITEDQKQNKKTKENEALHHKKESSIKESKSISQEVVKDSNACHNKVTILSKKPESKTVQKITHSEILEGKPESTDIILKPESKAQDTITGNGQPQSRNEKIITEGKHEYTTKVSKGDASKGGFIKSHTESSTQHGFPDDIYTANATPMSMQPEEINHTNERLLSLIPEKGTESISEMISWVPDSSSADEAKMEIQGDVTNIRKKEYLIQNSQDYGIKENKMLKEWQRSDAQSSRESDRSQKREMLRLSPLIPADAQEENAEEKEEHDVILEERDSYCQLRSFPPQVDLSKLVDHAEETAEEMGYEIITQQEVRDSTCYVPQEEFTELHGHDLRMEELLENEYEIIEALDETPLSEQQQSDLKVEPVDTYCLVCQCPFLAEDKLFGEHQGHEVSTLDEAYDDVRSKLGEWISMLQERSEVIEDLVSELETAYNAVEEHFKTSEDSLHKQNEEIMKMVVDQYNEMSLNMEEEKKAKLEQLYDQIVAFQENIDRAKETLEKTVKEIEEPDQLSFVSSSTEIKDRLTAALESSMSLELTPSAFPMFEDYSKSSSGHRRKELEGIAIPQKPHLQVQEPNSATSTSVMVYWKVNEGDVIDCFQVYCMEEPQGAVTEEYRVTVKESYCTLEDLDPDKSYKVWVMGVNYTGCSLPSDKLSYRTAPSVPTIDTERCTVLWDSATIRWSPAHRETADSFTLEYCRQYACEGEGLRSISGIRGCEQKVLLQPNENYLFYIKAVNAAGSSDQSEAALISTRGTRFHLLKDSAHPALEVSEDLSSIEWGNEAPTQADMARCPSVPGELLPPRGYYYWETCVSSCEAYRIGVAYEGRACDYPLGEDSMSWCLYCTSTPTSCRCELLHNSLQSEVVVAVAPGRIGTLLDFTRGRLSFFNSQSGQLLGSCCHHFSEACHPVLVLENAGSLALHTVMEVPEFAKN